MSKNSRPALIWYLFVQSFGWITLSLSFALLVAYGTGSAAYFGMVLSSIVVMAWPVLALIILSSQILIFYKLERYQIYGLSVSLIVTVAVMDFFLGSGSLLHSIRAIVESIGGEQEIIQRGWR